ncbi:MAG: hypothetical protein JO361_06640 [Gammaproteobacteria bacterium]|nr:hypothetical protein [Gammaproteobacteria bacterium]
MWLAFLLVGACQRQSSPPAEGAPAKAEAAEEAGVALTPEEIEKAGIRTTAAVAVERSPETTGYAVVLAHEAIAQSVADLATAAAAERQSSAARERARRLAGTPGAMSAESQEAAARQAAVDHAALVLAERRLSATYGQNAPWRDNFASPELAALAGGTLKLARVTFPLGSAAGLAVPGKLRFTHIDGSPGGKGFESLSAWSAPADAALPGKSLFAVLKGADAGEGERLLAHAPTGAAAAGVVVPFAAVVIRDGKYWCYVEEKPGRFVRTELDTSVPTEDGYFLRQRIAPGARIVTTSAGELLARESSPGGAAD